MTLPRGRVAKAKAQRGHDVAASNAKLAQDRGMWMRDAQQYRVYNKVSKKYLPELMTLDQFTAYAGKVARLYSLRPVVS